MERGKGKRPGEHWDGRLRVSSTYDDASFDKLDRLAAACGVPRTTMQKYLVDLCLGNENVINFVQDQHKDRSRFRIIPSKVDGELKYIFAERKVQ